MKPKEYNKTHYALSKRYKQEKVQHAVCQTSKALALREVKGENGNLVQQKEKKRSGKKVVFTHNEVSSSGMMKFLSHRLNMAVKNPSTSQQHLSVSESPLNLEVTPDAPTIDTERRKSEIEIESKACQS
ncbi:hypothetical protein TNCV_3480981 [Trichonephila clavipes]|nr:hypothetical protein TNCV_3480981 [Trichonephila clavipes]